MFSLACQQLVLSPLAILVGISHDYFDCQMVNSLLWDFAVKNCLFLCLFSSVETQIPSSQSRLWYVSYFSAEIAPELTCGSLFKVTCDPLVWPPQLVCLFRRCVVTKSPDFFHSSDEELGIFQKAHCSFRWNLSSWALNLVLSRLKSLLSRHLIS